MLSVISLNNNLKNTTWILVSSLDGNTRIEKWMISLNKQVKDLADTLPKNCINNNNNNNRQKMQKRQQVFLPPSTLAAAHSELQLMPVRTSTGLLNPE